MISAIVKAEDLNSQNLQLTRPIKEYETLLNQKRSIPEADEAVLRKVLASGRGTALFRTDLLSILGENCQMTKKFPAFKAYLIQNAPRILKIEARDFNGPHERHSFELIFLLEVAKYDHGDTVDFYKKFDQLTEGRHRSMVQAILKKEAAAITKEKSKL